MRVGEIRKVLFRWPWLVAATAIVGVAGAVVLFWFQPQKAFIDDRVEDAIPTATTNPIATTSTPAKVAPPSDPGGSLPTSTVPIAEPIELARGMFVSLDHNTTGVVRVLQLADGSRIVRLEGLDTSNGPDLFLYLSTKPANGGVGGFDDDFVNLGRLKGNQGNQNYNLPANTDYTRFASVVIWCDRFNSAFGASDLIVT